MVCIQAGLLTRSILTPSRIAMIEWYNDRISAYSIIVSFTQSIIGLSGKNVKTRFRTYSSGDCSGFTPVFPFQALC